MLVGEKLKKLRKARGLSQEDLANDLNVSRQSISKWELGESLPDTNHLIRVSDYFGVSLDYLLRDKDLSEIKQQVVVKEVQPIISSGCLKKGIKAILIFVMGWFIFIVVLYNLIF